MAREGASSDFLRFLRIKHKVVQRLAKELKYYEAEVKQHEATVSRMKEENREPSDIKQQQNVLDETVLMVPDAESRLLRACAELDDYMISNSVCTEAARSLRTSASSPGKQQQRPQRQHEEQQQPHDTNVDTSAGDTNNKIAQQKHSHNSNDKADTTQHGRESNRPSADKQKHSSSMVDTKGNKVNGKESSQVQIEEEIYEEVRKIFETLSNIEKDLPQIRISLAVACQGAGGSAADELNEDDV